MRQDQAVEFQINPLSNDSNSGASEKKTPAPIELSLDVLGSVSGGLLPNGTWSSAQSLPNLVNEGTGAPAVPIRGG